MACFIVPATEAIVTTVVTKVIKKNESGSDNTENALRFSDKLKWLNNMLWAARDFLLLSIYGMER